jgi:hypothetical protein
MVAKEPKSLLTKFFYRDNYLHFQILMQSATEMQICGEFTNYDEYRKSFDALEMRLSDFKAKAMPNVKNFKLELGLVKVA